MNWNGHWDGDGHLMYTGVTGAALFPLSTAGHDDLVAAALASSRDGGCEDNDDNTSDSHYFEHGDLGDCHDEEG